MATGVTIRDEPLDSPVARALIARLNAELAGLYPEPGANHFRLDLAEVAPGRGAFVVAFEGGGPVGCGGIRLIEPGTAEVKRMFVDPARRGHGIAGRVLEALEERALTLGATRFVLETGTRQAAAIALYTRAGYARIEPFGEYVLSAQTSVCMAKDPRGSSARGDA
jgi:GNAT superfamily N-acetyltransferase